MTGAHKREVAHLHGNVDLITVPVPEERAVAQSMMLEETMGIVVGIEALPKKMGTTVVALALSAGRIEALLMMTMITMVLPEEAVNQLKS